MENTNTQFSIPNIVKWLEQSYEGDKALTDVRVELQRYGGLTRDQINWLATRMKGGAPKPEAKSEQTLQPITDLFRTASEHLKYPRITLKLSDELTLVLRLAGAKSRYQGRVTVTDDGRYPDNAWFGSIDPQGAWEAPRGLQEELRELISSILQAMAKDPAAFAKLHGQRVGHCCFCARELTDDRSVHVGYGPVCADHFGLPWGEEQ